MHSPRTRIARLVLMRRTSNTTADSVHVLIALRTVLGKVNAGAEHSADVGMSFVETLLDDCIDKRTAVEEHAFAGLMAVLFADLGTTMIVALPQLAVLHLLDLGIGKLISYIVLSNLSLQ